MRLDLGCRTDSGKRAVDTHIEHIARADDGLHIQFVGSKRTGVLPWWWLADHGEDAEHRDPETLQRISDTFAIDAGVKPRGAALHSSRTKLAIKWPHGHPTLHTAQVLSAVLDGARRITPASETRLRRPPSHSGMGLWSTPAPSEAAEPFDYTDVIRGGSTTVRWRRHLWQWGFAVLDRVPPGRSPVKEIAAHLGYVRETIFGGIWELASNVTAHQDSAYDTTFLGPHTDGIYSNDGPGIQIFACQERQGTGGESILVDGFAAAARLFDAHPEHVDLLSRVPVVGRYIEPGVHLLAERPVLRFDPLGHLSQVSFNNYDRAPFLIRPRADAMAFREAYAALNDVVNDESSWMHLAWKPSQTLVLNNWRVLHGRTSYTGRRRFFGAYTNHEDFASRLRLDGSANP